ncbi:MAG: rRNA maturation RNase YbeY [Hyphomicrobiaceae bacterium]|nr:rRNA maturation RNase YbeY [Hyphomicrobiaceae bacterium]
MSAKPQARAATPSSPQAAGVPEAADPEPRSSIAIDLVEDDGDWSLFDDIDALISRAAAAAARHSAVASRLPRGAVEIVVALSSDAAVARLNGQYRGKPKPTNVLSFPAPSGSPAATLEQGTSLGDIVLAAETVRAEAEESGTSPAHHLQHLVVHAVLHLVGYDHMTDPEAEAMEAIEIEVLAGLGIDDPYAGSDPEKAAH